MQIKISITKGLSEPQGEELQQLVDQQVRAGCYESSLLIYLHAVLQAEENAGMAMIFTLGGEAPLQLATMIPLTFNRFVFI